MDITNKLKIILVRSRQARRLTLRVRPDGSLRITAPPAMHESQIMAFVNSKAEWIANSLREIAAEPEHPAEAFYRRLPLATKQQHREAADRLKAIVAPMIEHYSREMNVNPRQINLRATRSKWGSCNPRTATINLSLYLLLLPEWLVEHVVVHELAHMIEANHSARFYAVMDRYYPRWREARTATKALLNGQKPDNLVGN